nr:hypothetical protein [uncultured Methanoregula sp.]
MGVWLTRRYQEARDKVNRKKIASILYHEISRIKQRLDKISSFPSLSDFNTDEKFRENINVLLNFTSIFDLDMAISLSNLNYELRILEDFRIRVKAEYIEKITNLNFDLPYMTPHIDKAKKCVEITLDDLISEMNAG